MPSAREEDAGPAAFAPTTAATAQKAPVATAVRKRAPRMSPKLDESATMTCPIAKTIRAELKVTRRGTLSVKIAIAGVPRIIPIAKTVIIKPTFAIDVRGHPQSREECRRRRIRLCPSENSDGQHVDHERQAAGFFDGRCGIMRWSVLFLLTTRMSWRTCPGHHARRLRGSPGRWGYSKDSRCDRLRATVGAKTA